MLALALFVALFAGVLVGVPFAPAPARAASAATSTGGLFVSNTGRLWDTGAGTGGAPTSPVTANKWYTVGVAGRGAIPATGVSAVQVNFLVTGSSANGALHADKTGVATPNTSVSYVSYTNQNTSNAATIAVGSDGKIQVQLTSSANLRIDVQGYYTAGDTAAGGYVPVKATAIRGYTAQASNTTVSFNVAGTSLVPSTASGVMLSITAGNESSSNGYLIAFPAGTPRPTTTLYWPATRNYEWSTAVGLTNAVNGQVSVYVGSGGPVDLSIAVQGYFTANTGTSNAGAFTAAAARLYDSRSPSAPIAAQATSASIPIAGKKGVPTAGSGITSVAANVTLIAGTGATGHVQIFPDDKTPGANTQQITAAVDQSIFVIVPLGADGGIKIQNSSGGTLNVVVDVEGWYSSVSAAVPSGQTTTQKNLTLQGTQNTTGGSWVTYQYRNGITDAFQNVPVGDSTTPGTNNHPASWPVQQNASSTFDPYTWNVASTLNAAADAAGVARPTGALIQVVACFGTSQTDANPSCSMPSNVSYAPSAFGGARDTTDLGPGTLSLLTGDYQVSSADANAATSLGSLNVGRTLTTLAPAGSSAASSGVFGPGWTADLSGPDEGSATLAVTDNAAKGYELFTDTDGSTDLYAASTPVATYPITFSGVGESTGDGVVVTKTSASSITMTEDDGTATTWTKTGSTWQIATITPTGSNTASTFTTNATGLVTRILGPVPSGVTCTSPDTTPGCRSLVLAYGTMTVGGSTVTRLQTISTSFPQTSGTTNTVAVTKYDYTADGRLADAYDPRITPNLLTAYTYNAQGRLASLTPPGQAAWSISYDTAGRVSTVTRPTPAGPIATSTVVYDVPFTQNGAPVEMGLATTATWGQKDDLPATATAIFSPDRVPASTTPSSVTGGDWPYASIDYMDVNGRQVNQASYGAGAWQIDTTQYDNTGNDVWDLTPGNRAQILTLAAARQADASATAPDGMDPYVASLTDTTQQANLLASTTVFSPLDPAQVTDTFGPTHPITLSDGTTIDGRDHDATIYDEGAPVDGTTYDLPTTSTSDAVDAQSGAETVYPDAKITHTGYAAISTGDTTGWSLRMPTSSTAQMGATASSADLATINRYNAAGQTIESRLPAGSSGGTAQDTVTAYFTAGTGSGACLNPSKAGLACSTGPAAQPTSGNPLPVTTTTYDANGNPLTEVEVAGSTTRTTTATYDAAERLLTSSLAVIPVAAGGAPIPTVTTGYDSASGAVVSESTGSGMTLQANRTEYDNLGQPTSYTDTTGNKSTTSYDVSGNAKAVNDGKGTTNYTYDSSTEHRGLVTAEDLNLTGSPSVFTASYDASGAMATETYPNGLAATSTFDNTGAPVTLSYAKSGSTWMNFTETRGLDSQIVAQSSPQSAQKFTFDQFGRLTTVQDNVTSGQSSTCTTRQYTFDKNSNRTSLNTYSADGATGACSTSNQASNVTSTFDQADRITNLGYAYDSLGRTTTVPATDAPGSGNYASATGNLGLGYFANDMVKTESQGSSSVSYTLDPGQERFATIDDGTTVTTNHFDDDSDSPVWTSTSSTQWTRMLPGIDSEFAITTDQSGNASLALTNMHGDVVAHAPDSSSATGIQPASFSESTEYGAPRSPINAAETYGWLGSKQRSTSSLGGLVLMGVRLYSTVTGRFLSPDPVTAGNANSYVYPSDPISQTDLSGKCVTCDGGINSSSGPSGASIGEGSRAGGGARESGKRRPQFGRKYSSTPKVRMSSRVYRTRYQAKKAAYHTRNSYNSRRNYSAKFRGTHASGGRDHYHVDVYHYHHKVETIHYRWKH